MDPTLGGFDSSRQMPELIAQYPIKIHSLNIRSLLGLPRMKLKGQLDILVNVKSEKYMKKSRWFTVSSRQEVFAAAVLDDDRKPDEDLTRGHRADVGEFRRSSFGLESNEVLKKILKRCDPLALGLTPRWRSH